MTNYVFMGLGTNLGDREANLNRALELIGKSIGRIDSRSDIYETEPWGFQSENNFLNMVIKVHTNLKPTDLIKRIIHIENQLGRIRDSHRYISRTIDIDILLYGNIVIDNSNLTIPHPLIQDRKFVLVPLCDLAPGMIHPVLGKTFAVLLKECRDDREVKKYTSFLFTPKGAKKPLNETE
jgi:2-amino-4-hydroxy-6-hydroxymethyldihydropteridine diphosphokinase